MVGTDSRPRQLRVGVDVRCLADSEPRGFARYTHEILGALSRRADVELIGFHDAPAGDLGIEQVRLHARREIVREQIELPVRARRCRLDVLHAPANRGLPIASPCATTLTLHDAVEWDRDLTPSRSGRGQARFRYASVASLASASRIITPSLASARAIEHRLGVTRRRLVVIPEAANERFFVPAPPATIRSVRDRFRLTEPSVLYVGGFDAKKDLSTVIQAFALLPDPLASQLVLAGGAARDHAAVMSEVRSAGIEARTLVLGYVSDDDLAGLYQSAACFVFAGRAEGFGLPVVEAMASGLPVVVADAGSLPEVVGRAGSRFAPGDARELAARLEDLLASPRQREQAARNARERAREFSWDQAADRLVRVWREVAALRMPRRAIDSLRALRALPLWLR